jgi:ATP-dependent Clp protease ATP-binding subunit ClpC
MEFETPPPLPILGCQTCHATGSVGIKRCPTCHGLSVGRFSRGVFLYFGETMTRYQIAIRRARKIVYHAQIVAVLIAALVCISIFSWTIYGRIGFDALLTAGFWLEREGGAQLFLWFAVLCISFLVYRTFRYHQPPVTVDRKRYGDKDVEQGMDEELRWANVSRLPKKKKKDISKTFSPAAKAAVEQAYRIADGHNHPAVDATHLFWTLLSNSEVVGIFLRLGIPIKPLKRRIASTFHTEKTQRVPVLSDAIFQVLFVSYEDAYISRQPIVDVTELLLAAVGQSPDIQDMLYDIDIDKAKLDSVVQWVRIRARLRRRYLQTREAASHRNKHGLDRAMTAVATPFLNAFSQDLTMAAVYGHLPACVARDKELDEIFRIVESGRQSILLVGDHGVGKMSIMEGIVQRMIEDDVPARLQDKRMVQLSTTSLLAGTTVSGAQERLLKMVQEISKAKNIILFIHNLEDLMGGGDGSGFDVSEALAQFISSGRLLLFATTTPDGYNKHILRSQIGTAVARVDVKEMTTDQTIEVLQSKAGGIEYKQRIFFSYDSVHSAATFAEKFLHEQRLPESAIAIASEAASYVRSAKGEHQLVQKDDVAKIIHDKTGIPVTSLSQDESAKLLQLEDAMHKRVIGQEEAVTSVAASLRRARADVRSTKRPIANFLFIGSTGVGKTELAKTIADVYFGGEDRMIRVDMSEYQDSSSVYRLIGQTGQQGTGLLTEAVRQKPFSLVLLDEMEKADPKILDLFLQVFDDGRLTDSVGRVIDFTNTIMIATSNAGTAFVQQGIRDGLSREQIQEGLMRRELQQHFRPEFLNRFDGIITFHPLRPEHVRQIATLMLKRVEKDLETRGIGFRATDEGLVAIAERGYDPEFGARPLRRAIQNTVEDGLAELLLSNSVQRRDTVVLEADGLRIEHPA